MFQRRESHRFSVPPGGDHAMVIGEGGAAPIAARLLDTSATGMSLQIQGDWIPEVGQKVAIELASHDLTLGRVVRVERDGIGARLGLQRLADDTADTGNSEAADPIGKKLERKRRQWLPRRHLPIGVTVVIVGLALGFVLWRARKRVEEVSADHLLPSAATQSSAAHASPAAPPPDSGVPSSAPSAHVEAAPPQQTNGAPHLSETSAPRSKPPAPVDFERLLTRMPRTIQFHFRQLETLAASGSRGDVKKLRQIRQVIEEVEEKLAALFGEGGRDEAAFMQLGQKVLDDARRRIEALQK